MKDWLVNPFLFQNGQTLDPLGVGGFMKPSPYVPMKMTDIKPSGIGGFMQKIGNNPAAMQALLAASAAMMQPGGTSESIGRGLSAGLTTFNAAQQQELLKKLKEREADQQDRRLGQGDKELELGGRRVELAGEELGLRREELGVRRAESEIRNEDTKKSWRFKERQLDNQEAQTEAQRTYWEGMVNRENTTGMGQDERLALGLMAADAKRLGVPAESLEKDFASYYQRAVEMKNSADRPKLRVQAMQTAAMMYQLDPMRKHYEGMAETLRKGNKGSTVSGLDLYTQNKFPDLFTPSTEGAGGAGTAAPAPSPGVSAAASAVTAPQPEPTPGPDNRLYRPIDQALATVLDYYTTGAGTRPLSEAKAKLKATYGLTDEQLEALPTWQAIKQQADKKAALTGGR